MLDKNTEGWDRYYQQGRLAYMPELFVVRFLRALRNRGDFLREHNVDDWVLPESVSILDFGCGNGRHTIFLNQEGWSVTACDISRQAVAILADALRGNAKPPRLDVISDALPYENSSFDIVLAHGVFDHIPQRERGNWTAEVARVLKPDGLMFASFLAHSLHEAGSSPGEQILQDGEEAGLTQTFYSPESIIAEYGHVFNIRSMAYDNRGLVYPEQSVVEHRLWVFLDRRPGST